MTAFRKHLTLVAALVMIALTAFTVQAILDTSIHEPVSGALITGNSLDLTGGEQAGVSGTLITGSSVDVPEDNEDDLIGAMNKAADWLLQDNQ